MIIAFVLCINIYFYRWNWKITWKFNDNKVELIQKWIETSDRCFLTKYLNKNFHLICPGSLALFLWQAWSVKRRNDNNASNLVTWHTELCSMLMMSRSPPVPVEMLTFNLCPVISLCRHRNWCTLFPLMKSKMGRGQHFMNGWKGGARGQSVPRKKPEIFVLPEETLTSFNAFLFNDFLACFFPKVMKWGYRKVSRMLTGIWTYYVVSCSLEHVEIPGRWAGFPPTVTSGRWKTFTFRTSTVAIHKLYLSCFLLFIVYPLQIKLLQEKQKTRINPI